jgi:hypothetical protein
MVRRVPRRQGAGDDQKPSAHRLGGPERKRGTPTSTFRTKLPNPSAVVRIQLRLAASCSAASCSAWMRRSARLRGRPLPDRPLGLVGHAQDLGGRAVGVVGSVQRRGTVRRCRRGKLPGRTSSTDQRIPWGEPAKAASSARSAACRWGRGCWQPSVTSSRRGTGVSGSWLAPGGSSAGPAQGPLVAPGRRPTGPHGTAADEAEQATADRRPLSAGVAGHRPDRLLAPHGDY